MLDRIPADFEQVIERVPHYRSHAPLKAYDEFRHPEVDAVATPLRRRSGTPQHLPKWDGRDLACWYKWKGDEYIGYDWRAAERNPRIRLNYERAQRAAEVRRAWERKAQRWKRNGSRSGGSIRFNGWKWRCPVCGKTCRTIYFALPAINVIRDEFSLKLGVKVLRFAEGLACTKCHRVQNPCVSDRITWNSFIAYLTCGLL